MLPNDSNDKLIAHDRDESKGDAMTRPSDRQNPKSWVVVTPSGIPKLDASPWAPGYTAAHKKFPLEAIAHAITKTGEEATEVGLKMQRLQKLYEEQREMDQLMDEALDRPDFDGDMDAETMWMRGDG